MGRLMQVLSVKGAQESEVEVRVRQKEAWKARALLPPLVFARTSAYSGPLFKGRGLG